MPRALSLAETEAQADLLRRIEALTDFRVFEFREITVMRDAMISEAVKMGIDNESILASIRISRGLRP